MIPTTYYSPLHKNTFEVQIVDVQPQWAIAPLASVRCVIGMWNFNCTHFISIGEGHGWNAQDAFDNAVRDTMRDEVMNEDEQMLHGI